jgi:hypothetical protein
MHMCVKLTLLIVIILKIATEVSIDCERPFDTQTDFNPLWL